MKIEEKEVGKEYLKELKEILKIREERRKIYGDSFLNEKPDYIMKIIDGKLRRYNLIFHNKRLSKEQNEKMIDEIRDVCNYCIFLLCVLNKK